MKHVKQGKIHYLQPSWGEFPAVRAGFTTRNGGVSRPPYNSLNLGFNTDDARYNVDGNRSTLARAFDLPPHQLLTVKQVHGTDVLVLDQTNPDLSHFLSVECDAVITDQPGIMIGVLVADCYPVLLYAPGKKAAGVVHVGWRGAAAGILKKTVQAMQVSFGCNPGDLLAAVGPGIGAHKYEVDRQVRDAFRQGTGHWESIAEEVALGNWHLDLRKSCLLQLADAGLPAAGLSAADECTCCHRETLFSYRRDGGKTGRQLGFMILG
ncbi:MAG: laccase [Desulfuromonadaceae bacterium GWC2_58_13]|nr:MAG: laccase [Desulfuromonadaceae bacterium GWC2_58_13]